MPCLTYQTQQEIDDELMESAERKFQPRINLYILEIQKLEKEKANLEAALCAVMTSAKRHGYPLHIDEKEAGITAKQITSWFEEHKKKDAKRLEKEKQEKRRKALAKLSEEDKELLGIK